MSSWLRRLALLTWLWLGTAPALAAPADAAETELRRFVDDVQTMSARFTQTQTDERGETVSTSTGRMLLSRPGRFRWAYEQPYEQLMVCDGNKIWLYDPDLAQVTVRPAQETLGGTPAALLAQRATLTDEFSLEDLGRHGGSQGVKLKPRNDESDFSAIELWLRPQLGIERMVFHDRLGNRTDLAFTEVKVNQRIDEAQLRFAPPKGAEVIESAAPTE